MRPARSLALLTLVTLAMTAACAAPNLDEPAPLAVGDAPAASHTKYPSPSGSGSSAPASPSAAGSSAPSGSGSSGSSGPPGVDAGPEARQWKGTMASTLPVVFGGGQNCNYRITLKQVNVDIVAAASGEIVAANVTAVAFEEVLSPECANNPIPANTHTYALATATVLPSGLDHLELVGLSTNQPLAALVIEGDFTSASPELSLAWHRTDYGPPLDWRVNAKMTVTAQ